MSTVVPLGAASASPTSASDEAHLDLLEADGLLGAQLGITVVAGSPDRGDRFGDLRVVHLTPHQAAEIVALRREQAGVKGSVGREPRPRAVRAERLRD